MILMDYQLPYDRKRCISIAYQTFPNPFLLLLELSGPMSLPH